MKNIESTEQEAVKYISQYAANLWVNQKQSSEQTIEILNTKGLNDENAQIVVDNLHEQIICGQKSKSQKRYAVRCIVIRSRHHRDIQLSKGLPEVNKLL